MAKDYAKYFYNSNKWKACRTSFIARRIATDGGLCERCRSQLGFIVHHKINLTEQNINDPTISLNQIHLEYVCLDCHNEEHNMGRKKNKKIIFDKKGQPIKRI